MSNFEIIHNPFRPKPVYAVKPKQLSSPMVDLAVIGGLIVALLLTGYMHF